MAPRLRVGMGQLLVEGGEPKRNLERARKMADEAASQRCDILLLPECLDLAWTHPSAFNEAMPIPGPRSDVIIDIAKSTGLYICAGLTEQDEDKIYNTAIFVDPLGGILLKYRKINVLTVAQNMYSIGTWLSTVDTPFGRVGVNICSDNYGDALDLGMSLARMGAQIILSPSSWTVEFSAVEGQDPYGAKWLGPYKTLAEAGNLVVVSATSVGMIVGGVYEGKKMVGCSLCVGQAGVIARGNYNEFCSELMIAEFEVPAGPPKGTAFGENLRRRRVTLKY